MPRRGKGRKEPSPNEPEKFTHFYTKASPFSQHHPSLFVVDGINYNCAEQYMMHQKAVLFNDVNIADAILMESNPMQQKSYGRQVENFDNAVWKSKAEDIVKKANIAKFSQNPDMKASLLATRGTTLVEASPNDRVWGIGLAENNPLAWNRKTWKGTNLLGFILTSVRDELLLEEADGGQAAAEGGPDIGAKENANNS